MKNNLCVGIVAHVDSGKTTLSEAMLYTAGNIRKLGRVDNKDAFLDTYALERARGITIFSKQAQLNYKDTSITLLDTPGHVDFSAEMERTLQVLDYAILVISCADGVQGHTQTLWRLLEKYDIPTFLFINKMDQNGTDKEKLLEELKNRLSDGCVDFTDDVSEDFYDALAMCDEDAMEVFLENGIIDEEYIRELIVDRKVFPCFFGSALRLTGVESFMDGYTKYMMCPSYTDDFGAKVYKISRDSSGNRLTHMKITGGSLKVRTVFGEEKINQIRIYSGEKYEAVNEVFAGQVCAVTGLSDTRPGQGLGAEAASEPPVLEAVLNYQIILPQGVDAAVMLPKLRIIEEENPELHIVWNEQLQEIQAQLMGEVQVEILQNLIEDRFDVHVEFGTGNIVYKETITDIVEGVGHYEPLRHYAEVHLILEPLPLGSGLVFDTCCSEDDLDKNWQRLIFTHLMEKEYKGVLAGCPITDMKITLSAGRAHIKHTEGGDFRQSTYRAVRNGLMQANSVLLEPYYDFRLEVPTVYIGRAMTDIEKMQGTFGTPDQMGDMAILTGSAPVATMRNYPQEVIAYSRGEGRIFCDFKGYAPCHNTEEVLESIGYDALADVDDSAGSVFCHHGAGVYVPWDEVPNYMHVESTLKDYLGKKTVENTEDFVDNYVPQKEEVWIDIEEIDSILERTFYANRGRNTKKKWTKTRRREVSVPSTRVYKAPSVLEEYMLVDGYNIIYDWEELRSHVKDNLDGARGVLMDILCNYQAIRKIHLMVVFDAYKVKGNVTTVSDYKNIKVVYTKEAETADQYIEKFAHENAKKYRITVATSDGLEQVIIRSQGCALLSARDLKEEIELASKNLKETFIENKPQEKIRLADLISEDALKMMQEAAKENT